MNEAPQNEAPQKDVTLNPEELRRIFSALAHDLKSPIFSIDGFSELLQSDYSDKLDDDGRDFLARIRSSVSQIKRVIDDMSHLVKLLSRPNASRPVDLRELVEEMRLKYANLIDEGGVDLQVPDTLPSINADPEKLREALGALICNALTFSDRPRGERIVALSVDETEGNKRICVRDNGAGFDMKYAGQIFELGLKLDKQKGYGPGYGLFLARRIAESHGGELTVESTLGEGSVFCLSLPA